MFFDSPSYTSKRSNHLRFVPDRGRAGEAGDEDDFSA